MGGISRRGAFAFSGLTIWLLALAFVRPLSVDESQYVAASALTAHGLLPYRDYAYLQTPLQPFVFAPLHLLFPGHLLLAIRLANALIGAATAVLVYLTARRIGASERAPGSSADSTTTPDGSTRSMNASKARVTASGVP